MRFSRPDEENGMGKELEKKQKGKDGLVGELSHLREKRAKVLRVLAMIREVIFRKERKQNE